MSHEPSAKRVRRGAKSCVECRHRKIRCIWPSEGAETCQSCLARGRTCEVQVHMVPASETATSTSRARIGHLEGDVSRLWTAVRNLESKLGCVPTEAATHPRAASQPEYAGGTHENVNEDDLNSNASDSSSTDPPSHLLQLFDNGLLDSGHGIASPSRHAPGQHKEYGGSALRKLMPSREDMLTIATHASSWLPLLTALFPVTTVMNTGDEMLAHYDKLQDPRSDPVAIAALLLSVAITVQQAPDDTAGHSAKSIGDASSFIKDVSDTVERIIISDDDLACSLEGIETTLMFLRLDFLSLPSQLGRAKVRKMWLITRRVIALAELIGLPRASTSIASYQESSADTSHIASSEASSSTFVSRRQKAEVWESICAIDRITSMMWSLPLATINYPLPKRAIVDSQGQVNSQSYLYHLADVMSRILELDNIYSSGRPLIELFNAVVGTDQELRSLASLTPDSWWKTSWPEFSMYTLLQYWHQYLTIRTHLQLALKYNEGQEFVFNFVTCLDACQELARRYISIRPILPIGLFVNRVLDLQAFTAAVFLLIASYRTSHVSGTLLQAVDTNLNTSLVDEVVRVMGQVTKGTQGYSARHAADAVRSLISLLQQQQTSESQRITLSVPLVGRIHVSRKSNDAKMEPNQPYSAPTPHLPGPLQIPASSHGSIPAAQAMSFRSSDLNLMDPISYSMEIPENYPFLTDDPFGTDQQLAWADWEGTV